MHINHEEYYHDRLTESDLCYDFPGDEILIDGLHAMQLHLWSNNVQVDIPVVRVMNAAHFLAAYMFATTCSGDRMEYDTLAYSSVGHDQKLVLVTMVVLAAMLSRTEGFRARNCRNLIISGRGADFEEGLTHYERFLRSAEQRFAEEDFLIDTHTQIQHLTAENEQLTIENKQLRYTITTMENKYQQIIIGTQNNNCTQIENQYNITYVMPSTGSSEQPQQVQDEPEPVDSIIFTKKAKKEGKEAVIIEALKNSVQGRKDKTRAFVDELHAWQKEQYIDAHYNAKVMYDELEKIIPLTFGYETFKKYYNNTI